MRHFLAIGTTGPLASARSAPLALEADWRCLRRPRGALRIPRKLWQGRAFNLPVRLAKRPDTPSPDTLMRLAAFECVRGLNEIHDHLTAKELKRSCAIYLRLCVNIWLDWVMMFRSRS